jgi:hypothetical protein
MKPQAESESQGQEETKIRRGHERFVGVVGAALIVVVISLALLFRSLCDSSSALERFTYRGQPARVWFYGKRSDFFLASTRDSAQKAIDELGTNAFPFLLTTLKAKRGNTPLYFKLYWKVPGFVRQKMPYPISGDDIKAITLNHIRQMRPLAGDEVRSFADCVPRLQNPRLRMQGFYIMLGKYQTQPAFLNLCHQLIDDKHPGVQLQAAISLAQSAIQANPGEPRLFPILMAALKSKQLRKLDLDIRGYQYQRQPPGKPGGWQPNLPGLTVDQDEPLRAEIMRALDTLERYLTPAQKDEIRDFGRTSGSARASQMPGGGDGRRGPPPASAEQP